MNKLNRMFLMLAACAAMFLPSCASIVASGPDKVMVNSDPDGARVSLDGIPVGRTPCAVEVPRNSDGLLTFELDGYQRAVVDLDRSFNGWILGNLVIGGGLFPGLIQFLQQGLVLGVAPVRAVHRDDRNRRVGAVDLDIVRAGRIGLVAHVVRH